MMSVDIGDHVVGAYLKLVQKCDFVDYNVQPPGASSDDTSRFDVVGMDFDGKRIYLCSVATHITGLRYGNDNNETVEHIRNKYRFMREYAVAYLPAFDEQHFMFWSPVVREGFLTHELGKIDGLEIVINEKYARCIDELKKRAAETMHDVGNPFFRSLQIIERLRT